METKVDDYISEDQFEKKYFGYIIKKYKLDNKTSSGNTKYKVFVGLEGEVLYEHICIRFYSETFKKHMNVYTSKPYNLKKKPSKQTTETKVVEKTVTIRSNEDSEEIEPEPFDNFDILFSKKAMEAQLLAYQEHDQNQ